MPAIDPDRRRRQGMACPRSQCFLEGDLQLTSEDNKVGTFAVLRPSLGNRIVLFPAASVGGGGHKVLLGLQGGQHRP